MMTILIQIIMIIIRSQPYAFSVDGSSGELVAAGGTETETQVLRMVVMVMVMVMMVLMIMVMVMVMVMTTVLMIKTKRCARIG